VSVVSRAAGVPCEEALFGGLLADLPLIGVEALLAAEVQVAEKVKSVRRTSPNLPRPDALGLATPFAIGRMREAGIPAMLRHREGR
jgi:hypothetical protein